MKERIKGRLKLPSQGVDIPFTILTEASTPRFMYGLIANDARVQTFDTNAGWVFEPDAPPLPTTTGYYTRKSNLTEGGRLRLTANLYRLEGGLWHLGGGQIPKDEMRVRHAFDPLVLLTVNKA